MSNFIKVTEAASQKELIIPFCNIDDIEDGLVWLRDGDSVQVVDTIRTIEDGLLRDEFAKVALPQLINTRVTVEQATSSAYLYADAMLKERMK